ncbi:sugar ABC transporter ATP-binding protein [Marinomonas algicola]|uniref:sugar ABC transporter ATP-binding protein n=1 Tax=Marinomonas algicola TaxID=2773454 RepID=UPI0017482442|nr:sugar ABC transporter ATP-binding protein [Marinomonas algicola]
MAIKSEPIESDETLLQFRNITKKFGNTIAVNDVSFNVGSHSVVALLGENGAGKSTLIKILAGVYQEDSGGIRYQGDSLSKKARQNHEIAFIHQDLGLVDWMTVAENMALSMGYCKRVGLIDWKATNARAADALAMVKADIDPRTRVFRLSRSEQSLIAIARAVYCKAKILVLDEPTASLPASDVARLFEVIRDLRKQGVGMIYVSHRLDEVMEISDSMVIMRDGFLVEKCDTQGVQEKELVEMIVGAEQKAFKRLQVNQTAPIILQATQFEAGHIGPISFNVKKGEILGLIGLRGGGQGEVGKTLFGDYPAFAGELLLEGETLSLESPLDAIKAGIGYVAGERSENLAMSMSVQENLFLNPLLGLASFFSMNALQKEKSYSMDLIERFDVRPNDPQQAVENLSGGNQQKVIVARWLNLNKKILILDEPTAGVDVGAKSEIYDLLKEAVRKGLTVIIVSTDFEEVEKICNRCYVFSKGKIHKELTSDEITFANMLKAASADGR